MQLRLTVHGTLNTQRMYIKARILFLIFLYGEPVTKYNKQTKQQTPWPLVRKLTIPTKGPPFVDEFSANFWG
jgi:hypothetical protein